MASVSFADLLVDKLSSFIPKMKETSFKPGSALCLMSDSSNMYTQYAEEMLDHLLVNGILTPEYELHKTVQRTKTEFPFLKNLGYNNLEQNKLGFSPHLFNVVQDSLRFAFGYPEMMHFPSNGILSHVMCDSFLNNSFTVIDKLQTEIFPKMKSDVQPVNGPRLKMSVSVKSCPLTERSDEKENKPKPVNGFKLNVELANRKTREINKRSRKRRRRQKKNRNTPKSPSAVKDVVDSLFTSSPASSHVQEKSQDEPKFIVSVEHNIPSSLVSSFVLSVGSVSDEDSDWDSSCEGDQPELADFEFTGLFLTNLSTPARCPHPIPTSVAECTVTSVFQDEEDEIARMQTVLVNVNKHWNECTKGIELKPKSPSKVSFASDDKLAQVFPVEIYDRKGEWETYALERLRFKRRIEELEKLISPCLAANHRLEVYKRLESDL